MKHFRWTCYLTIIHACARLYLLSQSSFAPLPQKSSSEHTNYSSDPHRSRIYHCWYYYLRIFWIWPQPGHCSLPTAQKIYFYFRYDSPQISYVFSLGFPKAGWKELTLCEGSVPQGWLLTVPFPGNRFSCPSCRCSLKCFHRAICLNLRNTQLSSWWRWAATLALRNLRCCQEKVSFWRASTKRWRPSWELNI